MNVIGICHHPRWDSFPPVFFCRQFGREVRDANQRFRCFYTGTRSICVRTIDASEVTWRANQFASTLCGDRALLTRTAFPTPPRFSASIRSLTVKSSRRSLLSEPRSDTCRSSRTVSWTPAWIAACRAGRPRQTVHTPALCFPARHARSCFFPEGPEGGKTHANFRASLPTVQSRPSFHRPKNTLLRTRRQIAR